MFHLYIGRNLNLSLLVRQSALLLLSQQTWTTSDNYNSDLRGNHSLIQELKCIRVFGDGLCIRFLLT